jgi:PhnB protein
MMKEIAAYLTFNGNCRKAMEFYQERLEAELYMMPFSKAPMKVPEGAENLIIHARQGEAVLMASDAMPGMTYQGGNNFWVAIKCESIEKTDRLFTAFSENAKIVMPAQETFWAARFGMLTDQFGVNWMFNFEKTRT